jgi:hypothetical protein
MEFSIDMADDRESVELRGDIDRDTCDVIDAVAKAKRLTRTQTVAMILSDWAVEKRHEATLVTRLTRGNGSGRE